MPGTRKQRGGLYKLPKEDYANWIDQYPKISPEALNTFFHTLEEHNVNSRNMEQEEKIKKMYPLYSQSVHSPHSSDYKAFENALRRYIERTTNIPVLWKKKYANSFLKPNNSNSGYETNQSSYSPRLRRSRKSRKSRKGSRKNN